MTIRESKSKNNITKALIGVEKNSRRRPESERGKTLIVTVLNVRREARLLSVLNTGIVKIGTITRDDRMLDGFRDFLIHFFYTIVQGKKLW
jgi:hypothetical protein